MTLTLLFLFILLNPSFSLSCPPGTYTTASSSCIPCPAGTYNPFPNVFGLSACILCPSGSYNPLPSQTTCLPCNLAPYAGFTTCSACPRDTVPGPSLNTSTCSSCNPFTLTLTPNECSVCPGRSRPIGALGSRVCATCPPGHVPEYPNLCRPCDGTRGEYATNDGCAGCPPGMTGMPLHAATKCVPCPTATARDTWVAGAMCYPCGEGRNEGVIGGISCVDKDKQCPDNFFRASGGGCETCGRGEKRQGAKCVKCPQGEESEGGTSEICTKCPKGMISGKFGCVCGPGWEGRRDGKRGCRKCRPGTAKATVGGICKRCDDGWVSGVKGATECTQCKMGWISGGIGKAKCKKCAPGFSSLRISEEGLVCVKRSTGCPRGAQRVDEEGGGWRCVKKGCPTGSFLKDGYCARCERGEKWDGKSECVKCDDDEISQGGTDRSCTKCAKGMRRVEGRCACVGARGMGVEWRNGMCKECREGWYGTEGASWCRKCPRGTKSGKGAVRCDMCPEGTYAMKKGSASCEKCQSGKSSVLRFTEGRGGKADGEIPFGVGSANCV